MVDGQSWSENELVGAFVENFAYLAHDLADWQRAGAEPYGLGSVFDELSLSKRLPAAVLVPPMNELRSIGVQPFSNLAGVPTPLGLSANALAAALSVPTNRITGILNGNRAITADTALRLARAFGTSPEFWLNAQASHDMARARVAMHDALDKVQVLLVA